MRNLRKGVDKYKKIVYNVGTKEMEVNKMKWINNGIKYKRGNHQFLIAKYDDVDVWFVTRANVITQQ